MTREVKVRPKCPETDYQVKLGHIIRFLGNGDQVKLTVMFRGREITYPKLGEDLLLEFAKDLEKYAKFKLPAIFEGREMHLLFTPNIPG